MRDAVKALRGNREAQEVITFSCLRSLNRGLWMSLGVVASIELLGLGKAGFGVLMAAAGAGALIAIPLSALLVGRRLLARWLALALIMCGALIAAIGAAAAGAAAIVFMVGWGVAMAISDVAGQAVLFRIVAPSSIARVTGLMESAKLMFEGAASLLGPLAVLVFGIRGALLFAGGGLWRLAYLGPTPHYASQLLPALLIGGAASGLVLPTTAAAATIPLPPQRLATASGMLGVSRGIGSALGVALLVAIIGNQPHTAGAFDGAWLLLISAATGAAAILAALGPVRRLRAPGQVAPQARVPFAPDAATIPTRAATLAARPRRLIVASLGMKRRDPSQRNPAHGQ